MPIMWCAISGHGYGHAAQVVPVLNELGRRIPGFRVLLRTTVPEKFFASRLHVPWELLHSQQDVGCVQRGPLTVDIPGTWQAYREFYETWDERLYAEAQAMKQYSPNVVLSNISYLALNAGAWAGVPAIGLGSLSWDQVLQEFVDPRDPTHKIIISHMRDAYKAADLVIRLTPFLAMEAFSHKIDVGPIGTPSPIMNESHRKTMNRRSMEPVVLVALGGVALDSLPFDRIEKLSPYQFLLDMSVPQKFSRLRSLSEFEMTFDELFAASDIILSKPGYATVVEAVAAGKPMVYVRRYNFVDEAPLVNYLHRHGRGCELSKEDFVSGDWQKALNAVVSIPKPEIPSPTSGITEAADVLMQYLVKS